MRVSLVVSAAAVVLLTASCGSSSPSEQWHRWQTVAGPLLTANGQHQSDLRAAMADNDAPSMTLACASVVDDADTGLTLQPPAELDLPWREWQSRMRDVGTTCLSLLTDGDLSSSDAAELQAVAETSASARQAWAVAEARFAATYLSTP